MLTLSTVMTLVKEVYENVSNGLTKPHIHSKIKLHVKVLIAIANDDCADSPQQLAQAALKTVGMDFYRWRA